MRTITVFNTADSGKGSLREAIAQAKSGDTIRFASQLSGKTIALKSGQLSLTKDLTIDGAQAPGLTISGSRKSRVFQLQKKKKATLKNLTIANGKTTGAGGGIDTRHESVLRLENVNLNNNTSALGGGIRVGHLAKATILNSRFKGNDGTLTNQYAGFSAGAISHNESRGQLVIKGSTFDGNKGFNGGAIYTASSLIFEIEDSLFKGNTAVKKGGGGAIFTDGVSSRGYKGPIKDGQIKITGSRFENNRAQGDGGALYLWGYDQDKAVIADTLILDNAATPNAKGKAKGGAIWAKMGLDIHNVTFAKNSATQQGGAIWLESKQPATIVNSTFSANRAIKDAGGAMFLNSGSTPINVVNTTLAYNSAGRANGALWFSKKHNITLKNSIVAFNTADRDHRQDQVGYQPKDGGGNLEYSTSPKALRVFPKGTFADPRLGALTSNKSTLIHPLRSGSPAIDAGVSAGAPKTDQRGIQRDKRIDIGAVEGASTQPTPSPLNPTPPKPPNTPVPISVQQNPVAYLSLNAWKGTAARDTSKIGGDNSGVLIGNAQWTKGINRRAVKFDGSGDAIHLQASSRINVGIHKERTVSLWFKADQTNNGNQKQVLYEEGGSTRGLNIYLDDGQLYVGGWNRPTNESNWAGTWLKTDNISANRWHRVDLVLSGGTQLKSNGLKGYLDGKQFGSGKASQLWSHTAGIGLGSIHDSTRFHDGQFPSSGSGFAGTIDEVNIFNDALSASELSTLL